MLLKYKQNWFQFLQITTVIVHVHILLGNKSVFLSFLNAEKHVSCTIILLCACHNTVYMTMSMGQYHKVDFRMEAMFSSSLPPVVCGRNHVLFALFVFVCVWWCPMHIVVCFCFVFLRSCVPYRMLPVSLHCPFLIAPSVFSNVLAFIDNLDQGEVFNIM